MVEDLEKKIAKMRRKEMINSPRSRLQDKSLGGKKLEDSRGPRSVGSIPELMLEASDHNQLVVRQNRSLRRQRVVSGRHEWRKQDIDQIYRERN